MKTTLAMIVVLAASLLCLPALAAAQGTVALDQLSSRLQIGDKVKVIDTEGRRWAVTAIVNHPSAVRAQPALDFLVQWVYRDAAIWAKAPLRE